MKSLVLPFSQVDHALGLALASRDGLRLDDLDVNRDLQVALELGGKALLKRLYLADLVDGEVGLGFNLKLDVIKRPARGEDDLIMRGDLRELGDDLLDLRGD